MIIRRAEERGVANFGWLHSHHTFSFGSYFDPNHMGFGPLRVINDDRVSPGGGFPSHGHENMEIISYVVEGGLEHKDSIGTGSVIVPGEVQRMSAGTGIRHSEFNASTEEPVRFLQIWIQPEGKGLQPSYEQKAFFSPGDSAEGFTLVGSPDGRGGSVTIHQDVLMYAARFNETQTTVGEFELSGGRIAWVQIVCGEIDLNGEVLREGDGVAIREASQLKFSDGKDAEVLVFDMKP